MKILLLALVLLSSQLLLAQDGLVCDSFDSDSKEISMTFPGESFKTLSKSSESKELQKYGSYVWRAYQVDALLCKTLDGPLDNFFVMKSDLHDDVAISEINAFDGSTIVLRSVIPESDLGNKAYVKYAVSTDGEGASYGVAVCERHENEKIVMMTQEKFAEDDKRAYRCAQYHKRGR